MKKAILFLFILGIGANVFAQKAESDQVAIKKLILTAYVDGLHNKGDLDVTREGFYPGFDLLILKNEGIVEKLPIYNWIAYAEMKRAGDPARPEGDEITTCDFEFVDITGNAAVAKIHLNKKGKRIFTDYLSLYNFPEGWKIVGKIYYKTPE